MALSLVSCGGNRSGDVRGIDSFTPTAADTIAMLRQMGDAYADATNRPDSATLAAILRLPDIRRRGLPESIYVTGPGTIISEDRNGLCNIASPDDILEGRRRFLEIEWAVDSTEYLAATARDLLCNPDGEPCHLRITYEIVPDTLVPVDTLWYHDGIEF